MTKLSIFPSPRRETTREQFQRDWLKRNEIVVIQKWQWPERTWLTCRLAELAKEKAQESK